jgi:hypothetical protein
MYTTWPYEGQDCFQGVLLQDREWEMKGLVQNCPETRMQSRAMFCHGFGLKRR